MSQLELNKCRCGGIPLVRKMNSKKYNVLCPHCQRYFSRDHDTREEAVAAWNENIGGKSRGKSK